MVSNNRNELPMVHQKVSMLDELPDLVKGAALHGSTMVVQLAVNQYDEGSNPSCAATSHDAIWQTSDTQNIGFVGSNPTVRTYFPDVM